jgi:hypothetical protein
MSFDYDDDYRVIDLSWVKQESEDEEKQTFLCPLCTPDGILHKVSDPKLLEFAGPDVIRYQCLSCGYLIDNTDSRIRRQEKVSTILPPSNKPNPPIFQTIKPDAKDKLRGTSLERFHEFSFDLDKGDVEQLRHEGLQLDKDITRSSVSGRRAIRTG